MEEEDRISNTDLVLANKKKDRGRRLSFSSSILHKLILTAAAFTFKDLNPILNGFGVGGRGPLAQQHVAALRSPWTRPSDSRQQKLQSC